MTEVLAWNPEGLSLRRRNQLFLSAHSTAEIGRPAEARSFLAQARTALADGRIFKVREHCDWLEGFLAWMDGDPPEAFRLLGRASDGFLASRSLPAAGFTLLDLAEFAGAAGEATRATKAGAQLEELATTLDRDLYRALAGAASAWAALAAGRSEDAAGAARTAAGILNSLGYRAFHGRALDVLGRALLAAGDTAAATTALSEAAAVFDACGAVWRKEAVQRVLVMAGHDPERAT